ncbi:alanine racemase [Synechococcus sp. PCC 6717]|jgi:alanine racemase|uniref:Alanine racemase n=1 Tax=Parathermosynechococcus lividus PCC 6715 TaxID=1917166 RepID=A0A2D2Q4Q9_PARLV|nr:alanine racemase [Thermostichus lividus]ATS19419.1 alanine racemase [Thermostichus lividus PCC 6715]MCI3280627.1 alanine racemase [Synechococcus sp. PCC 6717]
MLSQERLTSSHECERAWIEIDVAALAANTQQLRQWLDPNTGLLAVVKADAYGHGAVIVAQTVLANGATELGVATIPEGIALRQAGISAPILVLGSVNLPVQVQMMAQWQLQPTLSTPKQALIFSDYADHLQEPLDVQLMIDTGMGRLGCSWQDAVGFVQFVQRLPHLRIQGLYSHFASADDPDPTLMLQQQAAFEQVLRELKTLGLGNVRCHIANSAATLGNPASHYDLVRVGLSLYGVYPAAHLRQTVSLRPVMQVRARITLIKEIPAGAGISYGHQFIAPKPMKIAVVGIGYADGVPRLLSNRLEVLVQGRRVRQVGAITMDQLMIDVSDLEGLQEGDIVTLLGDDGNDCLTVDTWAQTLGTIPWEILCGFKNRLPRIPVD